MEFIQSTKGSRQICCDGYLYVKNKTLTNGNTYWECSQRRSGNGCKAKSRLNNADELIAFVHEHTHGPDPEKVSVIKARAGMKRSAKETNDSTTNIVTGNLTGLNENELARVPCVETMHRDVRRNGNQNVLVVPEIGRECLQLEACPTYFRRPIGLCRMTTTLPQSLYRKP